MSGPEVNDLTHHTGHWWSGAVIKGFCLYSTASFHSFSPSKVYILMTLSFSLHGNRCQVSLYTI